MCSRLMNLLLRVLPLTVWKQRFCDEYEEKLNTAPSRNYRQVCRNSRYVGKRRLVGRRLGKNLLGAGPQKEPRARIRGNRSYIKWTLCVPEKETAQIFGSADLDGSGVIHFDEFQELMKKNVDEEMGLCLKYRRQKFRTSLRKKFKTIVQMQPQTQEEKRRKMFDAIDLDGNGYLDANELRVLLRSVGEKGAYDIKNRYIRR